MAHQETDTAIASTDKQPVGRGALTQGPPPFFPEPPDDADDDGHHGDDGGQGGFPLGNARLAMLLFLGAESMFFAGLIGTFLVYRVANSTWPPPTLPRLPVGVTGINTLILLYSAVTMWQAQRIIRTGVRHDGGRLLLLTWLLGMTFLVVQGFEWVRLVKFGLTMASGVYGATFYTLIGCHGLHVFGATLWLFIVVLRAFAGRYDATQYTGLAVCGMYWYYVVGLWPFLYGLVYLY